MTITYKGRNAPAVAQDTTAPYADSAVFQWNVATAVGDLNIGYVLAKPFYTLPRTPAGWSLLGNIQSGTLGQSADAGSVSLSLYYKVRTASESSANPHFTSQYDPIYYGDYAWSKSTASTVPWNVSASFAADTDLSTTAVALNQFSLTPPYNVGEPVQAFRTGNEGLLIIGSTSDNADAVINTPVLTIPGCTLSALTSLDATATSTGSALRIYVWRFTITAGTATGPATFTGDVPTAAYSSVAAGLVRVAEINGPVVTAVPATATVVSQSLMEFLPPAEPLTIGVTAPSAEVGINVALPVDVFVESPAGSVDVTQQKGEMAATLDVSVATSAVLGVFDPVTGSALGEHRPVEVQVWDKFHTQALIIADGRMNLNWQEGLNDPGSGKFALHRFDSKATKENLPLFGIVKLVYAGRVVYGFRIETRELVVVGSDDYEAQVWQISGRGVLAMIDDAILYPEYGINKTAKTSERLFFFGSKEGPWYISSEWSQPQGMSLQAVPDDHPWRGMPAGWPDSDAQWIWPGDLNQPANPGKAWFRSYFDLGSEQQVQLYMSADDDAVAYIDGIPLIATGAVGDAYKNAAPYTPITLLPGRHLLAIEATNSSETIPEVFPIDTSTTAAISFAASGNDPYIGKGYKDGGNPYVNPDGSVDGGAVGAAVFDDDESNYWLSVGNYKGWSSAYEYVEGTFARQTVTAVRVKIKGGPCTVYVSLKDGDNGWNGDQTVPYRYRAVDSHANIRYVVSGRATPDQDITFNIPAQMADRVRVTISAEWDSGIWQYRWRSAVYTIQVTGEVRTGTYIRGGNFAGLLVSLASVDERGVITGIVHRSQPDGWLAHTGEEPGWRPPHVLLQIMEEARSRNVLGVLPIKMGFDPYIDSQGVPWTMARKRYNFEIGLSYLEIMKKLVDDSDMDVWLDPGTMTLHAAEYRGADRTGVVIIRPAHSATDISISNNVPGATRLIGKTQTSDTEMKLIELGSFEGEVTYGRVERLAEMADEDTVPALRDSMFKQLEKTAFETYDTTAQHTDAIGPRPYAEYNIGDFILLPGGFRGELVKHRILSLTLTEDGEAGELSISISSDVFDPEDLNPDEEVAP